MTWPAFKKEVREVTGVVHVTDVRDAQKAFIGLWLLSR